ncbi:MAG: hypothetical protein NTY09_14580 [bacterium]|nr:hypothetical protein [bacterium]
MGFSERKLIELINDRKQELTTGECRIVHTHSELVEYSIEKSEGGIVVNISGDIEKEMYLDIMRALAGSGIGRVQLESDGIWIGDDAAPDQVSISDHIACQRDNILSGTEASRKGEAFIDMKEAYEINRHRNSGEGFVVWHLGNGLEISDEEKKVAREAGCMVASDNVVPWVIAAKVAGVGISAVVHISF